MKFFVNLNFLSPIVARLPSIFHSQFLMLSIWVCRSSNSLQWAEITFVLDERFSLLYVFIVSVGLKPTPTSIFLGSGTSLSNKAVTTTRNSTFSRFSCTSRAASSTWLVGLAICMCSTAINLLQKVITITEDSVSTRIVSCFVTQVGACSCTTRLDVSCDSKVDIFDRLYLCRSSGPVLRVSAQLFYPWVIFLFCNGQCIWCRLECRLLSYRVH